MKLPLKEFQERAVRDLCGSLVAAREEVLRAKRLQAVSLSAPTGSGKTMILTALIETILEGDDERARDPNAVFLWVTDQPELNEQTRRKMLATSSVLAPHHLVTIDATFDQGTLYPGRVYFLNIQKLGKASTLIKKGDGRSTTLWEWLTNAVETSPASFYVVVDEAHRGMQEGKAREEANSIIQKLIKGSPGEVPPVPLVIGLSATPQRFNAVIEGTPRVHRPCSVPIDDVRSSGLLKEAIDLFHPDREATASDITMLRQAAREWKAYCSRWEAHCTNEGAPEVKPLLIVQVRDGSEGKVSRTDLAEVWSALNDELGNPPTETFAHAFQEGVPVKVGSALLRYLAPSAIDSDPAVRVILFKTSLSTGWDCPRAEVMMSFRAATDDTLIAQLVGRMVRAPLARRIESDDRLNSVALFLPHYDGESLKKVIARLQTSDPDFLPPTQVRIARDMVFYGRAPRKNELFKALQKVPSYTIPRKNRGTQVRRVCRFGTLLSRYELFADAPDAVRSELVAILKEEFESRQQSDEFRAVIRDSGTLRVRRVSWSFAPDQASDPEFVDVALSAENVEDLFDWAGRRLGEGLQISYWKQRVAEGATNNQRCKLEVFALASTPAVVDRLENVAQSRVQAWFADYGDGIESLPGAARQAFREIRELSAEPELSDLIYPETVGWAKTGQDWRDHVYSAEDGGFRCALNKWEATVVQEEMAQSDFAGWLRNPDRKPWSVCVPYEMQGEWRGCYPDFLVIRKKRESVKVDIVDPHLLELEDAHYKARGLAKYANRHADKFGRIVLAVVDERKRVRRLDLCDEAVRAKVTRVESNDQLRQLFETDG